MQYLKLQTCLGQKNIHQKTGCIYLDLNPDQEAQQAENLGRELLESYDPALAVSRIDISRKVEKALGDSEAKAKRRLVEEKILAFLKQKNQGLEDKYPRGFLPKLGRFLITGHRPEQSAFLRRFGSENIQGISSFLENDQTSKLTISLGRMTGADVNAIADHLIIARVPLAGRSLDNIAKAIWQAPVSIVREVAGLRSPNTGELLFKDESLEILDTFIAFKEANIAEPDLIPEYNIQSADDCSHFLLQIQYFPAYKVLTEKILDENALKDRERPEFRILFTQLAKRYDPANPAAFDNLLIKLKAKLPQQSGENLEQKKIDSGLARLNTVAAEVIKTYSVVDDRIRVLNKEINDCENAIKDTPPGTRENDAARRDYTNRKIEAGKNRTQFLLQAQNAEKSFQRQVENFLDLLRPFAGGAFTGALQELNTFLAMPVSTNDELEKQLDSNFKKALLKFTEDNNFKESLNQQLTNDFKSKLTNTEQTTCAGALVALNDLFLEELPTVPLPDPEKRQRVASLITAGQLARFQTQETLKAALQRDALAIAEGRTGKFRQWLSSKLVSSDIYTVEDIIQQIVELEIDSPLKVFEGLSVDASEADLIKLQRKHPDKVTTENLAKFYGALEIALKGFTLNGKQVILKNSDARKTADLIQLMKKFAIKLIRDDEIAKAKDKDNKDYAGLNDAQKFIKVTEQVFERSQALETQIREDYEAENNLFRLSFDRSAMKEMFGEKFAEANNEIKTERLWWEKDVDAKFIQHGISKAVRRVLDSGTRGTLEQGWRNTSVAGRKIGRGFYRQKGFSLSDIGYQPLYRLYKGGRFVHRKLQKHREKRLEAKRKKGGNLLVRLAKGFWKAFEYQPGQAKKAPAPEKK